MYVLDCCLNAFRALERVVMGVADREVKKFAFGVWWKVRIGVEEDLRSCLDAAPKLEVSLSGCRNVNAMLADIFMCCVDDELKYCEM